MSNKQLLNNFVVYYDIEKVYIEKDDNVISFFPAETSKLTGLLGVASKLEGSKAFPSKISDPPFAVEFKQEEDGYVFVQVGDIVLTFAQIDDMIQSVNEALRMYQNALVHDTLGPRVPYKDVTGPGSGLV